MAKKTTASSNRQQDLVALLRARAQHWVQFPNVTSVGVGFKVKAGVRTKQLSIQVTVREKLTPGQLKRRGVTPLPKFLKAADGQAVPVDVLRRTYRLAYQLVPPPRARSLAAASADPRLTRRSRLARVMPGVSVGHIDGIAGTVGAVVFDNATGTPLALSNAHVLQGNFGRVDDPVVQPGPNDDADMLNNTLGRLVRSHVGLAGDCAIASVDQRLVDESILELDTIPRRLARADVGDRVIKSGRTTGVTRGRVERVGLVFNFDYGPPIGVRDVGGFEIGPDPAEPSGAPISDGGDSGSLWLVAEDGAPTDIAVGLHFAVEEDPLDFTGRALACNIHSVMGVLDVSFARPG